MRKCDITCPECLADYTRIELFSEPGLPGEFRCAVCGRNIEAFDGSSQIVYRLTAQPDLKKRPSRKPAQNLDRLSTQQSVQGNEGYEARYRNADEY